MNEYNNHSRTSTLMFNMNNMEMRIEIYRKRIPNCVSKRFRDESNSCFIIVFVVYALFFCRIFFWIGFIYTVIFVGCLLFYVLTDCNRCLRIWRTYRQFIRSPVHLLASTLANIHQTFNIQRVFLYFGFHCRHITFMMRLRCERVVQNKQSTNLNSIQNMGTFCSFITCSRAFNGKII